MLVGERDLTGKVLAPTSKYYPEILVIDQYQQPHKRTYPKGLWNYM